MWPGIIDVPLDEVAHVGIYAFEQTVDIIDRQGHEVFFRPPEAVVVVLVEVAIEVFFVPSDKLRRTFMQDGLG